MKNKLSTRMIAYIVFMFVIMITLIASNVIIGVLFGDETSLRNIRFEEIGTTVNPTVQKLYFDYDGGLLETVSIQAFGFCDTQNDNTPGRKINVIFKNETTGETHISRNDAQNYGSKYFVVYAKIPTYMLPSGCYEILLNVIDNEETYGIASFNRHFLKTSTDFYEIPQKEAYDYRLKHGGLYNINKIGDNLLINSDFQINRLGKKEYQGSTYTTDCWRKNAEGSIHVTEKGIHLKDHALIRQLLIPTEDMLGKVLTFSACVDERIIMGSFWFPIEGGIVFEDDTVRFSIYLNEFGYWFVCTAKSDNLEIEWLKMEFGDNATPFQRTNAETELLRCENYYEKSSK